ncbi:hypothetical protein NQZ68_021944 [Dissostichus eleginoides]|nr:hypothetical protein NQZ68_021944 [Dissostichus eleginoides]
MEFGMEDQDLLFFPELLHPNGSESEVFPGDGGETVHLVVRCVMTSVYILIITVGLLGNITLVKIFITNSAMRSVPNIFISSLAAGDLLLLLTCVPVDAFRFFSTEWVFGEAACKLIPVIQLTSVGVSVFTLTALSADRYKAIVNPMDIQTSSAVFWTCLKAVSIWLLSILLAVPEAIFSQVVTMQGHRDLTNGTFVNCVPYPLANEMHPKIHSVMIFLVYFLIPLTIISVYYYHIARTLIKSAHNMPGEISEHTKRQRNKCQLHRNMTGGSLRCGNIPKKLPGVSAPCCETEAQLASLQEIHHPPSEMLQLPKRIFGENVKIFPRGNQSVQNSEMIGSANSSFLFLIYRLTSLRLESVKMETRKRLAKIVLVFVGLFALCWFPNHVLYMYRSFHYQQMDLSVAHLVVTLLSRVLSFSSSCVNPFALYLLSESFRRHFNSQLQCGRSPRPERQASYMHSTSHIRLTSIKKTLPTTAIIAPAANGNTNRQEVAL